MENENLKNENEKDLQNEKIENPETFTGEDLQKKIQSETDKVRTEYSQKMKQMEEELKELRPKKKTEAEQELENRIKILENKEKEVQAKELQLKVKDTLENNGLPKQLAKFLNIQGAKNEDLESYLGKVKEILTKHYNNTTLNNSYKPKNHTSNKETITKTEFEKMSYMDRINLFKTNKELYNKLSK